MPSQSLKDLAVQLQELSFRDMMAFSDSLNITSYHNGATRAEKILQWADGVTAPPVPVEPQNEDSIAAVNPPPFETAPSRITQ